MMDINLFKTENSLYLKKVCRKADVSREDDCDGYLIDCDEKEARRIINRLESINRGVGVSGCRGVGLGFRGVGKKIAVVGGDDAFNRRVVETLKVNFLVSPERGRKVDSLKQRDSGINHVVAKIAKEKGVKIVVDMGEINKLISQGFGVRDLGLGKKEVALRISRIMQNVRICRKVGCGLKIASFGFSEKEIFGEKERMAFGFSVGMSSVQVADCVKF